MYPKSSIIAASAFAVLLIGLPTRAAQQYAFICPQSTDLPGTAPTASMISVPGQKSKFFSVTVTNQTKDMAGVVLNFGRFAPIKSISFSTWDDGIGPLMLWGNIKDKAGRNYEIGTLDFTRTMNYATGFSTWTLSPATIQAISPKLTLEGVLVIEAIKYGSGSVLDPAGTTTNCLIGPMSVNGRQLKMPTTLGPCAYGLL